MLQRKSDKGLDSADMEDGAGDSDNIFNHFYCLDTYLFLMFTSTKRLT